MTSTAFFRMETLSAPMSKRKATRKCPKSPQHQGWIVLTHVVHEWVLVLRNKCVL